jgi:hypothetical protein
MVSGGARLTAAYSFLVYLTKHSEHLHKEKFVVFPEEQ